MAIAYSVCRHLLRKRWQNYGKIQNYWLNNLCQHLLRKRVKIIANFRILFVTPVGICVVAMSKSSKDFRIIFCITRVSICVFKFSRISRSSDFCLQRVSASAHSQCQNDRKHANYIEFQHLPCYDDKNGFWCEFIVYNVCQHLRLKMLDRQMNPYSAALKAEVWLPKSHLNLVRELTPPEQAYTIMV